jgi:hypothetical protein
MMLTRWNLLLTSEKEDNQLQIKYRKDSRLRTDKRIKQLEMSIGTPDATPETNPKMANLKKAQDERDNIEKEIRDFKQLREKNERQLRNLRKKWESLEMSRRMRLMASIDAGTSADDGVEDDDGAGVSIGHDASVCPATFTDDSSDDSATSTEAGESGSRTKEQTTRSHGEKFLQLPESRVSKLFTVSAGAEDTYVAWKFAMGNSIVDEPPKPPVNPKKVDLKKDIDMSDISAAM